MVVFRSSFADWNEVPTGSMNPTILEGDRIFVNKLAYDLRIPFTHISLVRISDPARGEIIIFDSQVSDNRLVKRVAGIPGDTVEMSNNVLRINGEELAYREISARGATVDQLESLSGIEHFVRISRNGTRMSDIPLTKVPEGHYLVLGDNRDNSADSRVIGFVPRKEIVGKAKAVVISLNYDNYYLPRWDRFFQPL
jgi:signal peptidase I